jgi:acid phosphatase
MRQFPSGIWCGLAWGLFACSPCFALPNPDHIVIIMEENHSPESIIGSPDAPYITSLAATGEFTNFYALTHPSQPNYLQPIPARTRAC